MAKVVNNKLVAVGSGKATIFIYDPENPDNEIKLTVTVRKKGDEGYRELIQPVADEFAVVGYETLKAYYILNSDDRDIGENGDLLSFGSTPSLSLFPSESVKLRIRLSEYFEDVTEVVFISGNERVVSVDENGVITANDEGYANITVRLRLNGKNTSYTKTVKIEVKDPYLRNGPTLVNYYGNGGLVEVPSNLLFTEIGQFAFSNFEYIPKEAHEISEDEPDTTKIWYIGEDTITKVVIPEGVEKIGPYAFAGLTALKEVVLPSTLKYIEYGAFFGCTSLEKVSGLENVITINKQAFANCDLRGTISLDSAHAIADYAFSANANLEKVIIPETLRSIGAYAFAADSSLSEVIINAEKIKLGMYAFMNCTSLAEISINANVIPTGAFYNCTKLTKVKLGADVSAFGEYAFTKTKTSFEISTGNTAFESTADGRAIISKKSFGGSELVTLVLASPNITGTFELSGVQIIGDGAFSGNTEITSVLMPDVHTIRSYAFADCSKLSSITLGKLKSIESYAFFNTPITVLPQFDESLGTIGNYAFAYTDLVNVIIPDGMNVLEGAFCECQKLKNVIIGNDVTLGKGAFMLGRETTHPRTGMQNWDFIFTEINGSNIYYHRYLSELVTLSIGKNVTIGDSAFLGAASLIRVTLGEGAIIEKMAFYNAHNLTDINLSEVIYIGEMAFSGDVLYQYTDPYQQNVYYDKATGDYIYRYYAPAFTSVNLSSVQTIGNNAFQYCESLVSVTLGDSVTTIPYMAFANCTSLKNVNLENVEKLDEGAFSYTKLESVNLSSVSDIGPYVFLYCDELREVTLGSIQCSIGEGAFAYCSSLTDVSNLASATHIDSYAFAYTALEEADLSGAIVIGDLAFMKPSPTSPEFVGTELPSLKVTLGESIVSLGDNPFANCKLIPFSSTTTTVWNGVEYTETVYTFDISETVKVIDGSLYCVVPYGLELTTYIGLGEKSVNIPEETVRISAMAFAASDVVRVTLPHTLNSIGHKAFYDCTKLDTIVFKSYFAPVLEEEFDQNYFFSGENFPDNSEYSAGDNVFDGLSIVPFTMYITLDATTNKFDYSTVYYGANFIDYIGHGADKLVMVAPSNGKFYDSFILSQYFNEKISGSVSADDNTLLAIEAINKLPTPVLLEHEDLVIAARAAYDKLSSMEQKALVYNYSVLITAETRIEAFKNSSTPEPEIPEVTPDSDLKSNDNSKVVMIVLMIIEGVIILGCGAFIVYYFIIRPKMRSKESENTKIAVDSSEKETDNLNAEVKEDSSELKEDGKNTEATDDSSEAKEDDTANE